MKNLKEKTNNDNNASLSGEKLDFPKIEFEYENIKIEYNKLYNEYLLKGESPFPSLYYSDIYSNNNIHSLYHKNDEVKFFFSEKKYILNIVCSTNNISLKYDIYSTYEINKIIQDMKIDNLFFQNHKYNKNINYFQLGENNIITFYYDVEENIELPEISKNIGIFLLKRSIYPYELTSNYNLYFGDDINSKINYFFSEEKDNLNFVIEKCFENNKIFRFTGPRGIGKSFFLLFYSRIRYNCIYINIKCWKDLIKNKKYNKIKNILTEEFMRVKLTIEQITLYNDFMKNIKDFNINDIINDLIDFLLEKIKIEKITIILDQFKCEIDDADKFFEKKLKGIKIIICSIINDKYIRNSCMEYFVNINKNKINYKNFIYISKLHNGNQLQNNKIYSYFNNIPKYISRLKQCNTIEKYEYEIGEINKRITKNIKEFYNKENDYNENYTENLIKIENNLNVFKNISELKELLSIYPLKYFIITLYYDKNEDSCFDIINIMDEINTVKYFKINYLFPYLEEIIESLKFEEQEKFFTDGLFVNHTGSTIGGFFELIANEYIKKNKIKLPEGGNHYELRVDRICDMTEIKPKLFECIKNMLSENEKKLSDKEDIRMVIESDDKENMAYDKLIDSSKQAYENLFIFNGNNISHIIENYIGRFNRITIKVKGDIKYEHIKKTNEAENENNEIKNSLEENINEKKNINNKIINIINENFELKDKNLLVMQTIENAAVYDLAYIYGPSKKKIFLGFQMKTYKDYNKKNRTFSIYKDKVIDKSCQLLLNSKYLLDINIIEWHYIVVGIYFSKEDLIKFNEYRNYSECLINHCKSNNLELILFDPINKKFLDSKNPNKELTEIKLTKFSCLSKEIGNIYQFPKPQEKRNYFLGRKRRSEMCHESEEALNSIFGCTLNQNNLINTAKFVKEKIMNLLEIPDLKFIKKDKYDSNFYPIPNDNYLLMFKLSLEKENNNIFDFCFILKKENENIRIVAPYLDNLNTCPKFIIQYFNYLNLEKDYYVFYFGKD